MWIAFNEANGISFFAVQMVLQARARGEAACCDQPPNSRPQQNLPVFGFAVSQVLKPAFGARWVCLGLYLESACVSLSVPASTFHLGSAPGKPANWLLYDSCFD